MIALDPWAWAALAVAAAVIGISKTALPGGSILAIALFAAVLPARTSTAATLLLLMVGDLFALFAYRRHAHWPTLLRLAPAVIAGLLVGFAFLALAGDGVVRRAIGVILLLMIAVTLWRRWRQSRADTASPPSSGILLAGAYGTLGGFTTMVANAGGPVMSMYFLATRTPVQVFLGTSAWFFAIINVIKVPFLAGLGLFEPPVLLMDAVLAPLVVVGALLGLRVARRMNQRVFDRIVIALTIVGAVYLLI
ncbi:MULTISPECIES: sulfite exporter TauE/SafE family protein [unclassified Microbacterium]|uniref:sulfite exporter TauE/SafE family protein n=1 Tax=unclassified Microbacterium TaxID=2609290 RepID=UPI00109B8E53|nr:MULTISPECIES: sulfite exporter TauE/SafE family protein [unclassified Microbacterium]MCV0334217.1 sulfite exporter TauE/SafE family protein [Microbacterium sp.]MCV0374255.1 sulfite exporter TauE/SafE family protein [Microbacterium sp.]MCV0389327.1 sulfite exporter TauE/SafE family protein [Microbacterium sp.]MCV0418861.1 sulfite exporter TauE/SafE family protein [Microbacterium sp.]MCV0421167.1 sulfite exporter TauE/SafE family protein [Microbacterium sp.]